MLEKNKSVIITVCAVAAVLLVILGIYLTLTLVGKDGDGAGDDVAYETIEGVYSLSLGEGGNSVYTFYRDGTGKRVYATADSSDPTEEEFTYEIAVLEEGRMIYITQTATGVRSAHSFSTGKFGQTDFVEINEVIYYKQ